MNAFIIDGYVDEPACFGVPPYISPYVRYAAGVFFSHNYNLRYMTCDKWRRNREEAADIIEFSDIVLVIMGLTVPGRYRGGSPLTLKELEEISTMKRFGKLILGGPIHRGYTLRGGSIAQKIFLPDVDFVATGDPEASLEHYCLTGEWRDDLKRTYNWIDEIAPLGAQILPMHPSYPNVIAEMELSRGCDRIGKKCSFCTEGLNSLYEERSAKGIIREITAISSLGGTAFRLGRCSNILAWGGYVTEYGIRPNAENLEELYSGIRKSVEKIEMLHTDNCNPLTIVNFPEESRKSLEVIVKYNTQGDGLSLGIESVDPIVKKINNLKVSFEEAVFAVSLINEVGNTKETSFSLPALLPGLNFIIGLAGESKETLRWNAKFLQKLLDENYAVRRINIRRVMLFPDSPLSNELQRNLYNIPEKEYKKWKNWVRTTVDPIMLERVAPNGTILKNVITEERRGNVIFGRQLGSYPPLVGIVSQSMEIGEKLDVMVTDRGGRSLTAVEYPLNINECSLVELKTLPNLGKARASFLLSQRPYQSLEDLKETLRMLDFPNAVEILLPYFTKIAN